VDVTSGIAVATTARMTGSAPDRRDSHWKELIDGKSSDALSKKQNFQN